MPWPRLSSTSKLWFTHQLLLGTLVPHLSLSFFVCEMGIIYTRSTGTFLSFKLDTVCKMISSVFGTLSVLDES